MKRRESRPTKPRQRKTYASLAGRGVKSSAVAVRPCQLPIVGLGASAGGLDAFKKLFSSLPDDSGAAFILIQHLDPTRKSLTADLVGRSTHMRVVEAEDGMPVEANHVYVIPPNEYLSISGHSLHLSPPTEPRSLRMAIDFFLRSLAESQQENAVGVILSGSGTDGTLGLREIKAAGGMTMVQDPQTAQHDGMPRSAIATGCVDYIVPLERMAETLVAYLYRRARVTTPESVSEANDPMMRVIGLLQVHTKFDFSGYKKGTLRRRLQHRMSLQHIEQMSVYLDLLRADPAEATALFKELLINVTSFFRDPAAWQLLQEQVIRRLVAAKDDGGVLRVWVPACATGEEAYSLAIVLTDEIHASGKNLRLQVFASDVDTEALNSARAGVYPEGIAAHVSTERLARYFLKDEHTYRVTKDLRDSVVFAQQSLVSDPPFSKLDLVSCRNLFIYLETKIQERLLPLLHFALLDGGYLFLGSAEGVGTQQDLFAAVSAKWRIYRRVGPTRHERLQFPVSPTSMPIVRGKMPIGAAPGRVATLAQHLLLQRYARACVIINRIGEILYFHGRTDDYLAQPDGVPTQDLLAMARNGLRAKLRSAVQAAMRDNQAVVVTEVPVRRHGKFPRVKIFVEPLTGMTEAEPLWLVSLEDEAESATPNPPSPASAAANRTDAALVHQLEYELKASKEDLQQTIEELRASNEELMSVNEELQSSNEELETSKEELQSVNEELGTANAQLESKISELQATNNDLDNLLTSTNIATLFLDRQLCIRRFTPAATQLFRLIPADIGRPIGDIALRFTDPELLSDAASVLKKAGVPNREVQAQDGRWYVRQVLPYVTRDGPPEGVVVTLSDVAAEALLEARLYAEAIVDTVREPLLVLNPDLHVMSANRSFYATFRTSAMETVGRLLFDLGDGSWDIPQLRSLLGEVLPKQHVMNDFEVQHKSAAGMRTMLLNARVVLRVAARPDLILLAIEDVTERKQVQEALMEGEARKHGEEQVRQRQVDLAHALRISTIGELASGLAHELTQPLSAIANGVEACIRYVRSGKAKPGDLLALLDDASAEALRAGEIVQHLRVFIEKGTPQFESTDLCAIVRSIPRVLRRELQQEEITLHVGVPSRPMPIHADAIQIEQILVNLIQNAIDAIREAPHGAKEIDLRIRGVKGMAEVTVQDSGAGVSKAASERMFEAFFSTKPEGLGMGLAISRSIIEAHSGRIWMELPAGDFPGTVVRFTLPLEAPRSRKRVSA